MKRLFPLMILIFTVLITFSSCSNEKMVIDDSPFDSNFEHLPTFEDMSRVFSGMSFEEVISIIGKPHGHADFVSHSNGYQWVTSEGEVFTMLFLPKEHFDASGMSRREYYEHIYAMGNPVSQKIVFPENSISSSEDCIILNGVHYYKILEPNGFGRLLSYYLTVPSENVSNGDEIYLIINNQPINVTSFCICPDESY